MTTTLWPSIERLLPSVRKPARYVGSEGNIISTEPAPGAVRWLLVFPDTYEIGLPNLGVQILYELLGDLPGAHAERAYAPWPDMAASMRSAGVPLFSVDRHVAARDFDVLGFTFPSELLYTNLLECLDLSGLPLRAADRTAAHPLVIAGGHAVMNPEPVADFVDAVVIGDGEEVAVDITRVVTAHKRASPEGHRSKRDLLVDLARLDGVYVPALYDVMYHDDGKIASIRPNHPAAPDMVNKRTITDLDVMPYPRHPLIPLTEVVHDRLSVEVFRGCTRGCRFCQAGMITRPVRERKPETIQKMVAAGLAESGYEDVGLLSLSSADYSGIEELVTNLLDAHGEDRVGVSLPSLRADAFTVGIASQLQRVKKTGLTFAPEAGTWRMRSVINKMVTDDDLCAAVSVAYESGHKHVKLYFMLGLPTETDDDVLAIATLASRVLDIGRQHRKGASVTVSVGGFVPKAHTPFQWLDQNSAAELERKLALLKGATRRRGIELRWQDPATSMAEGITSRGDRRIADVIEHVWRAGGVFQQWREYFDLDLWSEALLACGFDPDSYICRSREEDEILPWDHITAGVRREFLWDEYSDAMCSVESTDLLGDCRWIPCYDCGVCIDSDLDHRVGCPASPTRAVTRAPIRAHPSDVGRPSEVSVADVAPSIVRLRFRLSKMGKARFTSHLDDVRIWERAVRRARLPIAFTEGFSARPRMHFGPALPTTFASTAEYMDLDFSQPIDPAEAAIELDAAMPAGFGVLACCGIEAPARSLQSMVEAAEYIVSFHAGGVGWIGELDDAVREVIAADSLPTVITKPGKKVEVDLRAGILALEVLDPSRSSPLALPPRLTGVPVHLFTQGSLWCRLAAQPRSVRPTELLDVLPGCPAAHLIHRSAQLVRNTDGSWTEPIPLEETIHGSLCTQEEGHETTATEHQATTAVGFG